MLNRRNLALKILHAVVRWAPPGAGEWPDAMLREVDFIENDWMAVSWALGSTRLLFTRQAGHDQLGSLSRRMEDLTRKVRRRTGGGFALASTETFLYGLLLYKFPSTVQRFGCLVGIAAMLYTGCQLFVWRARNPLIASDSSYDVDRYRAELTRQRDFHRGSCFWSRLTLMIFALILFCVGGLVAQPDTIRYYAAIGIGFLCVRMIAVWLNLREASKYQHEIKCLNELPAHSFGCTATSGHFVNFRQGVHREADTQKFAAVCHTRGHARVRAKHHSSRRS
jgi:hypothetical protein